MLWPLERAGERGGVQLYNATNVTASPTSVTIAGVSLGLGATISSANLSAQTVGAPTTVVGASGTQFYSAALWLELALNLLNANPVLTTLTSQLDSALTGVANDCDGRHNARERLDPAAHGKDVVNAEATITYTPNAGLPGVDTFNFTESDSMGLTSSAAVTVNVQALPPVAVNDAYTTTSGVTLTVTSPGLLSNDTDPSGNALTATAATPPTHEMPTLKANGSFT